MIHDDFRVTGAHDTVLDYADLFSVILRDDNVQEFDTRWIEILLSVTCGQNTTRTTHWCTYSASQNTLHVYSHSSREHASLESFALVC